MIYDTGFKQKINSLKVYYKRTKKRELCPAILIGRCFLALFLTNNLVVIIVYCYEYHVYEHCEEYLV